MKRKDRHAAYKYALNEIEKDPHSLWHYCCVLIQEYMDKNKISYQDQGPDAFGRKIVSIDIEKECPEFWKQRPAIPPYQVVWWSTGDKIVDNQSRMVALKEAIKNSTRRAIVMYWFAIFMLTFGDIAHVTGERYTKHTLK